MSFIGIDKYDRRRTMLLKFLMCMAIAPVLCLLVLCIGGLSGMWQLIRGFPSELRTIWHWCQDSEW